MGENKLAKINFYRLEIKDIKSGEILERDIAALLKNCIDDMGDSERFCKGGRCSAILSDYLTNEENTEIQLPSNITFDFSKFTDKKVNSAIIGNPLKDTDTFVELNLKTIDSIKYVKNDSIIISKIISSNKSFDKTIKLLSETNIDHYIIYKVMLDKNLNFFNDDQSLNFKDYYYDNVLNRLQKDKTYFNITKINKTNVLSVLYNIDGFNYRKVIEYLNLHILIKKNLKLIPYTIYEDNFSDILDHSEMKIFEFSYKSVEKSLLDKKGFNTLFETVSDLMGKKGKHEIKISVNADKDHMLSNEKIICLFRLLKESGLMETCKVKKNGSRNFVDSASIGDLLTYTSQLKFDSIKNSNLIFLDAYNKKLTTILDRIA